MALIYLVLSLAGLAGVIAFRRGKSPTSYWHANRIGIAALATGIGANLLVLIFSSGLFWVAPGESIRPMGWAAFMFMLGGATFVVVLPLSVIALVREKQSLLGVFGLILSLAPIPFSMVLLHGLSAMIGYHLAE